MAEDIQNREEINARLSSAIEEIATSTQTVYEAVEQVAKSASALAKAGQESVEQAKLLQEKNADTIKVIDFITNIAGLDTQHIGLAAWHADGLHLLNASSIHHKVVEEPMTLRQYLYRHKTMPGIRVLRIQ